MENENQESKSNGMELLENVVKSNERNIASNLENKESNAEVKADITARSYIKDITFDKDEIIFTTEAVINNDENSNVKIWYRKLLNYN